MNTSSLVGKVVGAPHFHWLRHPDSPPQAFMACQLRLRGPQAEGDTLARVVVYGEDAEYLFPRLGAGDLLEVSGRYRVRINEEAAANLQELLPLDDKLARLLRTAVQVHEFVAYPHQIRQLPLKTLATANSEGGTE